MLTIEIPGFGTLALKHLVLDYNGTLAVDGTLLDGIAERIRELAAQLQVHVLTADTFGTCKTALAGLPLTVTVLGGGAEDEAKLDYVEKLGAESCACVGNGRNDRLMLQACGLGIAVIEGEGVALDALSAADIVAGSAVAALNLLVNPVRIKASLRV